MIRVFAKRGYGMSDEQYLLFAFGKEYMLTADIQEYFGGSIISFRSAVGGFVVGALLTHFTRWGSGDK